MKIKLINRFKFFGNTYNLTMKKGGDASYVVDGIAVSNCAVLDGT